MDLQKKHIYSIDLALIVGTLVAVIVAVGYAQPLVIAPLEDYTSTNSSVLFTFQRGDMILIDDNINFTSPEKIYAEDNLVVNLKPGVYYWKIVGELASEIRTLTIVSNVDLRIQDNGETLDVVNSGNLPLDVRVFDNDTLVQKIVLDVNTQTALNGSTVIGGTHE